MKKIGILTFHRSVNNGAVIQCYSLCQELKRKFPDCMVEVIDYNSPSEEMAYDATLKNYLYGRSFASKLRRIGSLIKDPMKLVRIERKKKVFRNALNHLPLSPQLIIENDNHKLYEYINSRYDILIVGSDAIWNFNSRGFPNPFLPGKEVSIPKLSFAASCYGMEYLNLPLETKRSIAESLSHFTFIAVRDDATMDFVKWSNPCVQAYHTCDPSALLDINALPINEEELLEKLENRGFDIKKPTIGVMGDSRMMHMVRSFYSNKYQLVSLFNYVPGADVQLYDLSPYEWAYVFRFFKLTFTTYFHGTMLSLRNGVPLICVALNTDFSKKHVPKTLDVLKRLGFQSWYFKTDYKNNVKEIKEKADELLNSQLHDSIISKLDEELKTTDVFFDNLRTIISGKHKGDKD